LDIIYELFTLAKAGFIEKEKRNFPQKIIFILKAFAILVVLKLLSIGLSYLLDYTEIYKKPTHIGFNKISDFSFLKKVFVLAIYSPIIEELAFRIGLKFSKWNVIIMFTFSSFTFIKLYFISDWFFSILTSLILGFIVFIIFNNKIIFNSIEKFWWQNKRLVFYFSLFVFSFMHLNNYNITYELILFSPIVVSSHICAGFIFSYTRLKLGIVLAMILHSINNALPLILVFLAE
jgi:hypothetical protein